MVVNSISFLLFFAVVFIVYYFHCILPAEGKGWKKTKSMAACCQLLFLRVY